jgi:hypothetical protein
MNVNELSKDEDKVKLSGSRLFSEWLVPEEGFARDIS